ncbi:MAG: type II toxin-antitoxin system YafQ family toxin [Alphaproteobacteria bacterium]|jgi:mRNA interferase YafQ
MLFVKFHTSFKKDLKKCVKRGKDISKFNIVLDILEKNRFLPFKYKDHKLIGNYKGFRELHIEPDWLLIYKIEGENLLLHRMGSHNDLFD